MSRITETTDRTAVRTPDSGSGQAAVRATMKMPSSKMPSGTGQAGVRKVCLDLAENHGWPDLTLDGETSAMSPQNWRDFCVDAPLEDVGEAMVKLENGQGSVAGEPSWDDGRDADHQEFMAVARGRA